MDAEPHRHEPARGRLGGLVLACLVVLGAFWASRGFHFPSDAPIPAPSPSVLLTADAPVIFTGVGSQDTQAFHLAGGTYRTVWSAWGEAPQFPPCTHSVELLVTNPDTAAAHVADLAKLVSVPATGASEERYLANAEPGSYYLHITSACSWQIALSPNS